jgi:hypothetical protein
VPPGPGRAAAPRLAAGRLPRTLLSAVLGLLPPLLPAAQPDPACFLAAVEARLRAARALPDNTARRQACAALLAEAFDTAALARTAAAEVWDGLSPQRRAALEAAVRARLARECPSLLARPDPGDAVVHRQREVPGGLQVTLQLPAADGSGSVLVWTLSPGGSLGWRAAELVADGRGVAATLHVEFAAALAARGGDADAAIADLAGAR